MGVDRDRIDVHLPLRPVEFHILLSLAAGDRHGYGIIQDIEARGEATVPDVGTMYRALARMAESGLIEAAAPPRGAIRQRTSGAITTALPAAACASPRRRRAASTRSLVPPASVACSRRRRDERRAAPARVRAVIQAAAALVSSGLPRRDGPRRQEALIDGLARELFPNGGAVGATIVSQERPLLVVGVADQPRLFNPYRDYENPQLFVRAEDFGSPA